MDDILYIVLVVLWVAFGLFQNARKQQKKKANTPPPQPGRTPQTHQSRPEYIPRPTPQPDFEDVLGELLGLPKETPDRRPAYEPVKQAEAGSPMQYSQLIDQIRKPAYASIEFDSPGAQYSTKAGMEDEATEPFPQDFDLRQAVIYAAILQKPYQS